MHLPAAWCIWPSFLPISADSLVYHRAETVLRKGTLFLGKETLFLVVFLCSAAAFPDTETVLKKKTWCMGPGTHAGVDYNSLDLIVNSVVSYPPPIQKTGVEWGRSLILDEHFCICLLSSKQPIRKGRVWKREREGARAYLKSLNRHFMEHGQTPCLSYFNPTLYLDSHKMTMNLSPWLYVTRDNMDQSCDNSFVLEAI